MEIDSIDTFVISVAYADAYVMAPHSKVCLSIIFLQDTVNRKPWTGFRTRLRKPHSKCGSIVWLALTEMIPALSVPIIKRKIALSEWMCMCMCHSIVVKLTKSCHHQSMREFQPIVRCQCMRMPLPLKVGRRSFVRVAFNFFPVHAKTEDYPTDEGGFFCEL